MPVRAIGAALRRIQWRSLRTLLLEIVRYGLVSAFALGVDAGILKSLVTLGGWYYLPASVVSFIVGAVVAYFLSVRFVFRFRQVSSPALEFGSFVGLGLVGLLVNVTTLSMAISGFGLDLMPAKLVAAVWTFTANYLLRRILLFSAPRTSE